MMYADFGNTGCGVFKVNERFLAKNPLQSNEIIEFCELV
jgi:hypothetical protein